MNDPFFLPPQSVLSFSGGRTSGYMLWRTLRAFGGVWPEDRAVIFTNTGKERQETLVFIDRCAREWGVPVIWLEYRNEPDGTILRKGKQVPKWRHYAVRVDFETASRNGEPFEMVIRARQAVPNMKTRFCTGELKVRTTNRYVRTVLGWPKYRNAIGLRADEPNRVGKMRRRVWWFREGGKDAKESTLFGEIKMRGRRLEPLPPGETPVLPLDTAGVTKADVDAFWKAQAFDLEIPSDRGNCDLCFLKRAANLAETIRERPDLADWWIAVENRKLGTKPTGRYFRKPEDRPPYAELKRIALQRTDDPSTLFPGDTGATACDGYCGV